jgi:hypothetical protein
LKSNQKEASYDFFRLKILNFLALANGATQRASVLVKREGGTLRKQLVAVFSDRARWRVGL